MHRKVAALCALGMLSACSGSVTVSQGGSGGGGGGGGGGAACAATAFHAVLQHQDVQKVDLLFVVDNSPSMTDSQLLLGDAVPRAVWQLVDPACVDDAGNPGVTPDSPAVPCGSGLHRKIPPVRDLHLGVITTSLGGHGSAACNLPGQDDRAHLLGAVRPGLPSYNGTGFLAWDPEAQSSPPGENNIESLGAAFTEMVDNTGAAGCAYPAPLEAWYRFLVDPHPPEKIAFDAASQSTVTTGTDQELLAERADFLRPDSLVGIVMISDKNDCSVMDAGLGWLVGLGQPLPRATSICATKPDDPCCHSCGTSDPSGCAHDPVCDGPGYTASDDPPALRCWDQRRRFGLDLLYPTARYVNALTATTICPAHADLACGSTGTGDPNPLLTSGRNTDLVRLVAITGVPWQDVATDQTRDAPDKLAYDVPESDTERWHNIVGNPATNIPPGDPLMIETPDERTGSSPYGAKLAFERPIPKRDDLQYACVFPLSTPTPCAEAGSPLCKDPVTGADTQTQYYGKAYPGIRELDVIRQLPDGIGVPASICPKILDRSNPDYGFNPALGPVTQRLESTLSGRCLQQAPRVDAASGQADCTMVEATRAKDCARPGRIDLATLSDGPALRKDALAELAGKYCDGAGLPACGDLELCAIQQLDSASGCRTEAWPQSNASGFCYTDDPKLTDKCPPDAQRMLRLVGSDPDAPLPAQTAAYVIRCGCSG